MNEVSTIIIAIVVSILASAIMAWQASRTLKADRAIDMKRQDTVADELKKANGITNGKLEHIRELVNSNMTAQIKGRLESTIRERAALKALNALHPSSETESAIVLAEASIAELKATLKDRAG